MALDAELLKSLTEHMSPEDAKLFENLTGKYKPLEEGYLRQSDYDREMNKSKDEVAKAKAEAKQWIDWSKENVPIHENLLKGYRELETQQKELEKKLAEAQAARSASGDDSVNAEELARRVQEEVNRLGFVSRSDMDKIISEQSQKMAQSEVKASIDAATKKFFEETLPGTVNFSMDAAEIAYDYKHEFNQTLDRTKFSEFMKERNILEPKKAYEEFIRPLRDKAVMDAENEKWRKAKEDEMKQQYSAMGMPGGGMSNPLQPKGAVQLRMEAAEAAKPSSSAIAAAAAAAEMRNEGKL